MLNIGIDATSLCRKITGIEHYTLNLVKTILKIDQKNRYSIFFRKEIHPEIKDLKARAKFLICPVNNQIFCEQIWLPFVTRKEKIDLMHFPAFPPGLFTLRKYIVTIFDATIWKYSETISWKTKYYFKPLMTFAANRAIKILTISENSKKDISQFAKVSSDKIVNTYISIDDKFRIINDKILLSKTKSKYKLPDKFILSVCSIEPRKNLFKLLLAYKLLRCNDPTFEHKLVLVGRKAWGTKIILDKIKELNLEKHVVFTGYLPDRDLVCVYNLAEIFVYPSIYEGFGLPPLEAMACGTPVIASNVSSLPEAVGDAALLINPQDENDIARGIDVLDKSKMLQNKLINLGEMQVKKFSWIDTARKTINVYCS